MGTWQNWSGSVTCQPAAIRYPRSLDDIVAIVREGDASGHTIRVVGTGHSFTPLVATNGILISLDQYSGIEAVDPLAQTATVRAGTKIRDLGRLLYAHGLAQENLGDIDAQSIAGAISTGTHGTGLGFGSLSTQVIGFTLVTASGEILDCSADQHPEIFKAGRLSLGAFGIIAKLTLRLVPAYRLHYTWQREQLYPLLERLDHEITTHRNVEFYWQPYTDQIMLKRMNTTESQPRSSNRHMMRSMQELIVENSVFWVLSEISRRHPTTAPTISRLITKLVSSGSDIDNSHTIFATARLVKFQEMEYSIPLENLAVALQAIDTCIQRRRFQVHFPLECRVVQADDIHLSPAYGRTSAYIAVHMYKGMPHEAYFAAMETILRSYGGRPHWGKMHSLKAPDLEPLYPRWKQFQTIRTQLDPYGRFQTPYLKRLFEY